VLLLLCTKFPSGINTVSVYLHPAGGALRQSSHTVQPHGEQCPLWSACWYRCPPGSAVYWEWI